MLAPLCVSVCSRDFFSPEKELIMFTRFKKPWLAVLVAGLLVFSFQLSGCAKEPEESASLDGYWLSGGAYADGFEISGKNFLQYSDANKTVSFAGTIENDPDLSADAGIIIIKITDDGAWDTMTVGSYYGISWKNLSDDGVSESSAFKTDGNKNAGLPTLDEAKNEYTVENLYYGFYGDYARQ
jgi:hypothetical protein